MAGKWMIASARLNGERVYRAYRKLDEKAIDQEGNREYSGKPCADRKAVQALCDYLNAKENQA